MILAFVFALLAAEEGERVFGAPMVPGARKIEEGRYVSPRTYDDTLEFYEKLYKGTPNVRFRAIINAPGIKAVHMQNTKGGGWLGINIYEINNQTRLFVVKADPPAKK